MVCNIYGTFIGEQTFPNLMILVTNTIVEEVALVTPFINDFAWFNCENFYNCEIQYV